MVAVTFDRNAMRALIKGTIKQRLPWLNALVWRRRHKQRESQYWAARQHMQYYREVLRLARDHAPNARSVLDVGSMNCPFIQQFDWIPEKVSLDRYNQGRLRGVTNIQADFLTWQPGLVYDVVLCLQVLEHLKEPALFARKLLACGRRVIVTVPYRWPPGYEPSHVQDPVDETKVAAWLGRPWIEQLIVRETDEALARLIVVVDGTVDLANEKVMV